MNMITFLINWGNILNRINRINMVVKNDYDKAEGKKSFSGF